VTRLTLVVPERLAASCRTSADRQEWLERLPSHVQELATRWALEIGRTFDNDETSAAWVAPATRRDGTKVVLKLAMPHMEGEHEIAGLRFWNGNPTVRLVEADDSLGAMLLERCLPGTVLRTVPQSEQDGVIATLLQRLWQTPSEPHVFRPLADLMGFWANESVAAATSWPDPALVRAGLDLFDALPRTASRQVLLATDLHAGNVLRAEREPWLVIDPKPFIGDPAYDATQHLFNGMTRLLADPDGTIARFADLFCIDRERLRLWVFARAAAEPRDDWTDIQR
jgi:streptomycin 6-kinase